MTNTYISFYLNANRVHVFIEALRGIGSPKRICFMIDKDGRNLLLVPYGKRDFVSQFRKRFTREWIVWRSAAKSYAG